MSEGYEYCIMNRSQPDKIWRGPWSEKDCQRWMIGIKDEGFVPGLFSIARREVGLWESDY